MKTFRGLLIGLIAVCICVGAAQASDVVQAATSTTVYLSSATVAAGNTCTWSQQKLTNGCADSMCFVLDSTGHSINIGFKKVLFGKKFSWYSGTLNTKVLIAAQTLTGDTGKYKPYLTNSNTSKSVKVSSDSFIVIY